MLDTLDVNWGMSMFEVQADKGSACAEVFRSAEASYRISGIGLTRWARESSARGNLRILLYLLEYIDGQDQTVRLPKRMAGCSAMTRFRGLPPMRERIPFAAAIENSYHSVKMSEEFCQNGGRTFCTAPPDERSISSASAWRWKL